MFTIKIKGNIENYTGSFVPCNQKVCASPCALTNYDQATFCLDNVDEKVGSTRNITAINVFRFLSKYNCGSSY